MDTMARGRAWLAERGRLARGRFARINPYLVDSVITLASLAVSLWSVYNDDHHWPLWTYLLAACCCLPLLWRRRAPFTVFLVGCLFSGALGLLAHSAQPQIAVCGIVLIYNLADLGKNWQRWLMMAILVPANFLGTRSLNGMIFSEVTTIGSFALGTAVRELRRLAQVEAERARETGLRAASDAARAVAQERGRIAREMHDILAHAVSLMVIQAEAARWWCAATRTGRSRRSTPSPTPGATPWCSCAGCWAC